MKAFTIEIKLDYMEVMKKIMSECRISDESDAQSRKHFDQNVAVNTNKTHKCRVSGSKIRIEPNISYRNSFAPEMNLEIIPVGKHTRINGTISSLFSSDSSRKIIIVLVLIGSLGVLVLQTVRFFSTTFNQMDWVVAGISAVLFLSFLLTLFSDPKSKNSIASNDPYEIQMEHWISNLFPGESKILENKTDILQ